ncbi:MAG: zincin-like metallopeptidase domain-containing protein [Bacteroidota bacterium]
MKNQAGQAPGQGVDVYQLVTSRIIEALESGTIPWKRTWQGYGYAKNIVNGHVYSGINAILTNLSPYSIPYFLTMRQANDLGGNIKAGSKSLPIVYWDVRYQDEDGKYFKEDEIEGKKNLRKRFFARYYRVFNVADVEGVKIDLPVGQVNHEPIPDCEALVRNIPFPPVIQHKGDQPCYIPAIDTVQIPATELFESREAYYQTLFHELIHATGHMARLERPGIMEVSKFGSLTYCEEELIAEIGATFICNRVGIETSATFENSAAYIQGWLAQLSADKRMIFAAAGKARLAVGYLYEE